MQCKLKQGATVSNDFELQEGKYNAITKIISSPVFDEEGNIVKDGVFEAESFDSKKDADEYIDRRYQELLNRYKKLKNEAHQKLNQKLKEYEQQLEKDYEEYKRETGVKKLNPYETGGITLLPEEGYFEKAGKDKEKRKITAEIKKQLDNTINKIIELSDKLKADSSLDKEFKELQKEIGKVNSFKAQGFKLSEAQEGIIDSALELVNEINQETYTEAEELFTIGDTTGMALFGSEIEPSKINKLEKDTKFTKETIDNIESKLFAVQDMFKEIEQYDLTEEELASFKENYGKIYVVVKQLESGVVDGSNLIKPPVAEVIELTIDEAIDIIENRSSYEGKLSDKLDNALSQTENLGETNNDTDGETPDDVDDFQEEVYDLKNEEGMVLIYIDPDTGEELPYKLKAQTAPIYTGGYMSNVSIYSTTKPSETKTVDGKTVAVNSKMESSVTNLWENNLNSIWNAADQTTMEEEYGSLEKFIEGSKAAIESLNDNFDNKVFEFRKFKKTYPDFPINRKLKVIDDTHHEVLVMGISVNNKFYPVGEVRNPDGDYDPNGKSYKGEYGNNEEQRQQYQRAYLAIKTLWDKSGYDYSYSPEGYVFKYKGQYEIRNDNEQVLVKDIVNMGHKTIYAVVGSRVLQYNRESKNWEEVKNENKALSIRNIDRNKKTSFKNYILVEINGSFQKLPFSNAINDTKTIKDHEDGMNDLLNKNYDDISDNIKGFSIKKSGGAISAAITLFRFAIITKHEKRNNNNFPHTFSVARKSEGLQTPKIIQTINLNPNLRLVTDIYIENKKVNIKTYLSEAKENNKGKIVFERRNKPIKETEIESYNLESFLLHLKSIVKDNDKFSEFLSNNKITFDLKDHVTFNINSGKSIGSLSMLNNLRPIIEIRSSNVPVQKNDYAEKEKARKEEEARKAAEEAIRRQEENNAAYQKAREDAVVLMNEIFSGETNIKGKGVGLVSSVFRESPYNQSFENSEEAFRVVVYKGKKYFIGKTSKGVTIVFDDTILDVNKDTKKSKVGEIKDPEILNEVLNNDDLTIGYISGVVYNNARYIVHGNGRIISFTSGKDVFEKNSDDKIKKISELIEYVNKEVFGYETTTEEDVAQQKQQKQKMPKFKLIDNGILDFSDFQIENDLTKQKDVYNLLVKKLGKNKVDGLKGKVYSLNGQWLFNHNGKRLVMFIKVGDFLNPVYFSSQGTSGKSLTWHPFFGIDSKSGWIYKREFNPSTGKLSFSDRWEKYNDSILLLENVLQDLFLNFNLQDFKFELLNKIESQDLRNNIFINNQVLGNYVVENEETRVMTSDSADQYVVSTLYYMNQKIVPATEEGVAEQTGNIIEDINQELAYNIQKEREEELKNKITYLENKLKSITEKTSASSASSVMDKIEQGDIKNSIKSLKSELNSTPPVKIPDSLKDLIVTTIVHGKEQTIFTTYNLDRTVVFVQIDGKRYGFYQSTKGTDGKIENHWYPFYGKANGWIVKDGGGKNWKYNTEASPELQEKLKNASERLNREYGNAQFKNVPYIHDESEFETNELIGSNIVDAKQDLQENFDEYINVKKETAEKGFKQPKGAKPFISLRTQQTDEFTEDNNFADDPIETPAVDDTQINTGSVTQKPETTTANPSTINEDSLFGMFGGTPTETTTTNDPFPNAPKVDGSNIGDNDDATFSTSDQKATQQDISKARKILSKIVPFDVREMDPMIQNMLNDKTAIGAFYKNAIYLLDGTQKFHEAFHGVFRTILSDREIDDVLKEAKKKYAKPSLDDISRLRYLTEHNQTLSTEQLINLYYEEKLAEDFQQYMDTGRSVWSRIWDKILDIIRFITGGERDRIYSLFRNIENGKYANSKVRTNSPYAFKEPAFAVINTIRSNSYNNPAKFFVPANQTKTISALIAREIFDDNIDKKKKEEYYPYFSKVREVFNPIKWYEYFKANNDPNIVSNMMTILDYYNALVVPGEPMFMIDANGNIKQIVNVDNIINKNVKSIIDEVNELLKFYVNNDENGENLDDENNDDDYEDETGEPVEIFNRDSYKFGGFKSETSAIRNLMAIITYDKKLFADVGNNKVGDFQGEITMPVQAERLYNKILMLTSGVAKENILDVIAQAADSSNYDIQAFYNYIKEKIDNETSISNNDILVREGGIYDSPTYNLIIKAFYKNNHDYLHIRRRGDSDIAYYPNKFSVKSRVLQRWRSNEKGVMALKSHVRESYLQEFQDIISEELDTNDEYTFTKQMQIASEYLRDATGIELSPLYLKYTYYKRSGISSAFDNIKLPYITNTTLNVLSNTISSGGSLFQSDVVNNEINKILEASAYFNEEQVTFMLRNPEGEQIFTSLYNSYDTEILNTIKESFVEGYINFNVLREKLEQLGYGEQFVDRFMSMVSMNPIFSQKGLNEKDFDVLYSFGMDNASYNKLTDFERRSYKAKVYKNLPADLSNRKIYNPIIIEAKNTNKLFKFASFEKEISFKDGEYNIGEGVEQAINMLYLIEKDSIMRYNEDIEKLVNTGQLEYFIKDYHYRELELRDGSIGKVVYYNNDYYLISENYDTKSYDSHNVFTGYTVEKLQYIPDGFKEPKGAKFFNFGGLDLYDGNVKEFLVSMYLNMNSKDAVVLDNVFNEYQGDQKETKKFQFFVDDMIASSSFQYLLYGGSPTINHKDYVDITKRNAGVNANGSSIGNTSTVFAMIESKELNINDEYIKANNSGNTSQDVQDAQNYATAMWYFSKYAKYKGVASEKGEIRDIALKVVAGIKLTSDEVKVLEKNNMLLIDRKIVVRNSFVYDKTSVHIQAREKVSILREKNTDLVIRRWKEYLDNPSPELYNKIIMPMYVAKTGFEYHHNMLNSMEAQGIDITMVTSASKNSTFNVAKNPKNLRGFIVDDRFIHEQVRTDNIKTTITDPTQPLALVFSEQGNPQFQAIGEKFNAIQARRIFEATNKKIASVFTGRFNDPDYEKIWDVVKDSIAATDPQLYELLDVENGIPRYNWNIPNINAKIVSAYNSAMSKNSLKQKVKGSKMNLVSSYGHGNDLNWKITDDRFPGVFFSEVYVSQYFLDKMGLKVGDIMWGTRIPTQDKHSMGNLKIKGVIEGPYAMSIMLPKEMLFLSGADHDLDSLFVKVLNYKYSQNTINAIMDPNVDINKLYNDILNERKRNNPNFDEIALFDDLLLLTGVALTHNEANQDIYATKASLDAIKNSKVRRNENPIQSSISFSDRNNSEDSNYTSKGGIGPAAVLNLVFQKLAKTFPKEFKFTNVEGKRINDLISTHVSGMTDDPKEQIMSGYGLTKNNINKVITLMIAGNITYDQALLSVRDSGFTYAKKEKDRIMEAEYMISKDGVIDDELVKQYEKDGYVFEIVENEKGERYLKSVSNPNIPTINNVFKAKVYDSASFLLGEIIRVNRKLPAKASDFFKLENSMWSTAGIRVLREEIYEGDAEYSKINNLFLATNNDFVISDKKIYVDLGTHFTMISFDSKPKKSQKDVNEIVMKVIESDELVFNQLASYLVQSEFASKIFMKYSKIYNKMINKLKEKYDDLIEEASMYGRDDLVIQYKNIKDNVSEYAMAIMNGQKFLADNKKSLYEGLLTESIDDKSYIQFLSERILMEDSGIRLLKDIRYSTVVNEDSGKTYHVASLFTVGEDSDFIRTTYSNDYSNMLNASDNRTVLKEFIASPDKKAFIESLSLADAKVLMVGFIFDYAMLKDGMMYSGTSFSKIIDPRLFVSYGNSISSLQKSFSSNQEFARQYTNNDFSKIDDYVSRMIDYVFNSLNESIKTKEAKAIGINLSRYKPDTNKKATFIFASSGLGKSSLVKNANKRGDSRYVDIDYIIQESLDEVYPNEKGKHTNTAENSRRLGLETSVQNKLKELLSTKYSDKIVLGSISNEKLKAIGFSYSKYYVPSESMIPDIIKGIAERGKGAKDTISGNAYDIELEKYKSLYYDLYVSPNFVDKDKVVVVDSYLDDVINIDKGSIFTETANVSDVTVNGTEYQVIEQSVYKDKKDITSTLSTQLYSLILATRDFADGDSTKQTFNGKEYYVYNENKIFDIENMGFLSQDEIDVLTGKTETEFEGEPIEILSVIESLFNKYKDKEVLGQPITRELLEQLANEFGIDNLEDTLKNCI